MNREMERLWFTGIETQEDLQCAMSQLKAYLEEIVLSHGNAKIELWAQKRLPQFVERARNFQTS
jgi:hypothetical protein